jgi:hypothetical protein
MSRPWTLVAALVVVATNLGALGLAALNRTWAGTDVVLTERELRFLPSGTVTSLRIQWMQSGPAALTGEMVRRAGFRTEVGPGDPGAQEYYARQLQRQAFVALEYDGSAWTQYRDVLVRQAPGTNLSPAQQRDRDVALGQMIEGHSRLFVVDVDMDAARLRARHPDPRRHVIAGARVDVTLIGSPQGPIAAVSVRSLEPATINVPRPFSTALRQIAALPASAYADSLSSAPRYQVHLRYGRFHEPWIVRVDPLRMRP